MANPLWSEVELLLHCDGSDASTTFTDSSPNGYTVTASGNAQIDTAQSKWGGSSALFDGTGDYLSVGAAADWKFMHVSGAKWTVEAWLRTSTFTAGQLVFGTNRAGSANVGVAGWIQPTDRFIRLFVTAGSAVTICNVTTTTAYPNDGAWHHVAWVYDDTLGSANGKIYIDGTLAGSANRANTNSAANPSYTLSIGETGGGALPFNGHIDDLRIASSTYTIEVPAAAFIDGYVLTPATSIQANQGGTGFIPGYYVPATSTEAHQSGGAAITFTQTLSAGAGSGTVELLCHFDGSDGSTTLVDSSTYGNTLTATACALDTDIKKFGTASLLANDYAGVVDITATNAIGSSAWCIEGFVYIDAIQELSGFNILLADDILISLYRPLGADPYLSCEYVDGADQSQTLGGYGATLSTETWYHFAVSFDGTTMRGFIDGALDFDYATSVRTQTETAWTAATLWNTGDAFHLDDLRVTIGSAVYTAAFTAPADPLTAGESIAGSTQRNLATTGILGLTFSLPISIENYYRVHAGLPITFRVLSTPTLPTLGITVGAYAVTATLPVVFRLRSTPTLPTLPVVIYGNASASAGTDEAVTWKPKCLLDGTDISSLLIGAGDVEFEEMAAPVASFSLLPAAGTVDPLAYVGKRVTLAIQTLVAGVVAGEYLVFTGTISDPVWSVDDRVLTITATSDMQSVFDSMTKAEIDTQLASVSPQYSEIVFGDPADLSGYEYAEALISTVNAVLWQDAGGIIRVNSTLPKVSADYTVEDDARFIGADLSYPARMDMINKREIAIEYRFQRKRSREVKVSFRPWQLITPEVWLSCEGGWDLPQRDQIESAASGSGWYPIDDISYVDVWENNLYTTRSCSGVNFMAGLSISDEIRDTLCSGANWTAARRWLQTVTETASIVVGASESQAVVGVLADAESYGYESEYTDETWEDSLEEAEYSTTGMTQMASGDWKIDLDTDRSDFETAQEVAIAKARADILKSHRGTTVTFQTVFRPEIDLSHTVHLDCAWVEAQGKVRRVTHRWDQDTGSCTSEIAIALYRHNGAGLVTDTPVAATAKAADPDETAPDTILKLPMYIGGRDDCEPYDETWTGYVVNMAPYESASTDPVDRAEVWSRSPLNPAVQRYEPEGFHMIYPTIDSSYADPTNAAATATFDVAIPEDLLVLTA